VNETVRETFDITGHVRRHPWPAVGSAALLGCITGWLLTRARSPVRARAAAAPEAAPPAAPEVGADEGLLGELWVLLGAQGRDLARTALESVSEALKQTIREHALKLVSGAASRQTGAPDDPMSADRFDDRSASA
jgi:hypothetical protein